MLEDVYDFLGTFLIFPVDHFRSVVTRNLINNSRNQALRGKFHLEIVQGKIKISDPKNTKYDLQFVFRNNSILRESVYSLIYEFTNSLLFQRVCVLFSECTSFSKKSRVTNLQVLPPLTEYRGLFQSEFRPALVERSRRDPMTGA